VGVSKGNRGRPGTRIDWRDRSVWLTILILLAIGFSAAYGYWLRTWRLDIAREQDWYVATSVTRLRDFRARAGSFNEQRTTGALVDLALSASRLDGALVQIPRRGPVQWRAELVALSELLRNRIDAAAARHLAAPDPAYLGQLGEAAQALRFKIEDLEKALNNTVQRSGTKATALNFTPEVTKALMDAIAAARTAVEAMPQ
jgi:hypothetical protein